MIIGNGGEVSVSGAEEIGSGSSPLKLNAAVIGVWYSDTIGGDVALGAGAFHECFSPWKYCS